MVGPLNFCLLWSADKTSVVADACLDTRDVLEKIELWVSRQRDSTPATVADKESLRVQCEEYCSELNFCLQSLTLALSVIQTAQHAAVVSGVSRTLSVTTVQRVMARLAMHGGRAGDVAVAVGTVWWRPGGGRSSGDSVDPGPWHSCLTSGGAATSTLRLHLHAVRRVYELRVDDQPQPLPAQNLPASAAAQPVPAVPLVSAQPAWPWPCLRRSCPLPLPRHRSHRWLPRLRPCLAGMPTPV